jgi:hypothetical protein
LFIYSSGKDSPPPLQHSVHPTLFAACLYCSYCLLLSFSFFPGGGRSVQGAMQIWPRAVCGSTAVPLSSPCPCLPKPSGHGRLFFLTFKATGLMMGIPTSWLHLSLITSLKLYLLIPSQRELGFHNMKFGGQISVQPITVTFFHFGILYSFCSFYLLKIGSVLQYYF